MIRAFINGIREHETDFTTHYENERQMRAYDYGRYMMHRLTRRDEIS